MTYIWNVSHVCVELEIRSRIEYRISNKEFRMSKLRNQKAKGDPKEVESEMILFALDL